MAHGLDVIAVAPDVLRAVGHSFKPNEGATPAFAFTKESLLLLVRELCLNTVDERVVLFSSSKEVPSLVLVRKQSG